MPAALVLVVGGTGKLGSQVVDSLIARGKPVRALVRPTSQTAHLLESGVELAVGDMLDPTSVRNALDGV
ncbi:MAG TPA: NmrA family NAD(P)-binding protein, partial [Candidatus Acidoferrales bacterium]|nr:NmrA family NAD(P)-binding protein [Candidatus Acidoferrales bacterium]